MVDTEAFLLDRKRSANQRLGLVKLIGFIKKMRQTAKVGCNLWVIWTVRFFVYGERAPLQLFGLFIFSEPIL